MHSTELGANTVPAFLTKLWKLVEDSSCDDLICWGPIGMSFIIRNQAQFAKELLPLYFKHNNMASFIRQLNMYGFRKVANIEQGGLRAEKDEMEFQHQYFVKGQDYLLILIKRKIPTGKGNEEIKVRTEIVNRMLADMKQLKGHQETFDGKLQNMKRENEALWREVANLRQKHLKQQQIVNKLIHFLLTLVQPNHSIGMKRKIPLMFNENSHPHESKTQCLSRHLSYDGDKSCNKQNENSPSNHTPGPVIHEVTDLLETDKTFDSEDNIIDVTVNTDPIPSSSTTLPSSPPEATTSTVEDPVALAAAEAEVPTTLDELVSEFPLTDKCDLPCSPAVASVADATMDLPVKIESPSMSSENQVIDCSDETTRIPLDAALESVIGNDPEPLSNPMDCTNEVALFAGSDPDYSKIIKNDLSSYVDSIQNELENYRETLSSPGCNFSASTLLGVCSGSLLSSLLDEAQLFTPDDPLPSSSIMDQEVGDDKNEIIGHELVQYNPSLFELADDVNFFVNDEVSNPSIDDGTVLFDNVEAVLPEFNAEAELSTPDPLLSSPNLAPSKKRGRPKKTK